MNMLAQNYIHSDFTFVIKQPLKKHPARNESRAGCIDVPIGKGSLELGGDGFGYLSHLLGSELFLV